MIDPTAPSAPPRALKPQPLEAVPARRRALRLRPVVGWSLARLGLDGGMLLAAALASSLGSQAAGVDAAPVGWLALFGVLVVAAFGVRGMYRPRLRADILDDLRDVVTSTSLAAMAVLTLRALTTEPVDLSAQSLRPWAFATVYLAAGRVALHWSQVQARRRGESLRPTLIVGAGRIGRLMAKRLQSQPELGLRPIGFLDRDPMAAADGEVRLPVLGASWDLERVVADHDVQQVIVTFSTAPHEVLLRLVQRCDELGLDVSFVPRLFERMSERLTIDYVGGVPLVHPARRPNPRGLQFGSSTPPTACSRLAPRPRLAGDARWRRSPSGCRSAGPCSSSSGGWAATGASSTCSSSARCGHPKVTTAQSSRWLRTRLPEG